MSLHPDTEPSMDNSLSNKIEALLFSEGGPLAKKKLTQLLDVDTKDIDGAARLLSASLQGRGLALIESGTELALAVPGELKETIEKTYEKDLVPQVPDFGP